MGSTYFADASFWIALLNKRDQHHARAARWRRHIAGTRVPLITTHPVLWEMLNGLHAEPVRRQAAEVYRACFKDELIKTIEFDNETIEAAVAMYESRSDKDWGLTDCFSFIVMQRTGVHAALTADHHFQQAGFEALLLRDP